MRCVIGVDLGGTNVRAGAFFEDGTKAGEDFSQSSEAQLGTEAIIQSVASVVQRAIEASSARPESIGLAIPGHIDSAAGVVRWAPNFGGYENGVFVNWKDVPVRAMLNEYLDLPVFMDNDANMAALGEYRFGTGRNTAKCLVMLTLGTGVGGGVVLSPDAVLGDARGPLVLIGGNKGGAEMGHVVIAYQGVDCNAGEYGAIEAYCQRDGIIRRAQYRLKRGRQSLLSDLIRDEQGDVDLSRITPKLISQAAEQGDPVCIEIWEEVGTMLGVGIANFINIFAPDVVAIGGNIARAGELILGPARKAAINIAVTTLYDDAKIVQAEQLEDAGMLGAAALAVEALKWNRA